MNIKVDDEIIQRTTHCEHDFRCLFGPKRCLCEAKESVGNDMVEIKPRLVIDCKYHVSLGDTHFCNCPTRVEIYNNYNI